MLARRAEILKTLRAIPGGGRCATTSTSTSKRSWTGWSSSAASTWPCRRPWTAPVGSTGQHGELTVEVYEAHVAAEEVDHLAQIARLL